MTFIVVVFDMHLAFGDPCLHSASSTCFFLQCSSTRSRKVHTRFLPVSVSDASHDFCGLIYRRAAPPAAPSMKPVSHNSLVCDNGPHMECSMKEDSNLASCDARHM